MPFFDESAALLLFTDVLDVIGVKLSVWGLGVDVVGVFCHYLVSCKRENECM